LPPLAIALVLTAAVCHAAWNVLAHGLSRAGVPFLFWGAVVSTVLWVPLVPFTGGIGPNVAGAALGIAVSGALHVVYMAVLQQGYARGNLSTVYATARGTGPLLSVVAAVGLLGERPAPLALIGVAGVLGGVALVARADHPPGRSGRRLDPGIGFGLLTGVAIAAYTLWDAHAVRTWDISPMAYMAGCTLVEIPLYAVAAWRRRAELLSFGRAHWPRLLVFGVLSPLSYVLVLQAVTLAPVALVAPVREVSIVLVSVVGAWMLREARGTLRIAGALVVLAGVVTLALPA
jgi:drug/metabolite transporter (DMT)-like permease